MSRVRENIEDIRKIDIIETSVTTKQDTLVANDPAVKTALNASGTAPIYACRAWVNFNGTGTVAIRASGNVSSITDFGTGKYTVNFTTAMPDANYVAVMTGENGGSSSNVTIGKWVLTAPTSSAYSLFSNIGNVGDDLEYISFAAFH
jgi:hypothetical protein